MRHPQDVDDLRIEAGERTPRERGDDVVERALPAQRAGGDLSGERPVALVVRGPSDPRQRDAQIDRLSALAAVPLADSMPSTARSTSYAAARAGAIMGRRVEPRAAMRCPARKSRAGIARRAFRLKLAARGAPCRLPHATVEPVGAGPQDRTRRRVRRQSRRSPTCQRSVRYG